MTASLPLLSAADHFDRPTSPRDHSFTVAEPRLWNNLPLHLRDSQLTLLVFRWLLNTHLLCRGRRRLATFAFRAHYNFVFTLHLRYIALQNGGVKLFCWKIGLASAIQ